MNIYICIYIYRRHIYDASFRTPRKSVYIKNSSNNQWAPTSPAEVYLTLIYPALPQPVSGMAKSASPSFLWLSSCPSPTPALVSDVMAGFPLGLAPLCNPPHLACEQMCLHTHIHQRAALRHSNLFHLKFESTSNWLGRTVLHGTWIRNC